MATNKHTHGDIVNADVRRILALDLWKLRQAMRRVKINLDSDWAMGIRIGLDTMARRMDLYLRAGEGKVF